MIGAVIPGCFMGPGKRQLGEADAQLRRHRHQLLDDLASSRVHGMVDVEPRTGSPPASRVGGNLMSFAIFAGQPAVRQRAVGDDPHAVGGRRRDQISLQTAVQQAVNRLNTAEGLPTVAAGGPDEVDHLPGRHDDFEEHAAVARPLAGRATDVTNLARLNQIVERAQRLLDRGVGVGAVDLVEIDVVGLQPAKALLDLAEDMAAGEAAVVGPLAHRPAHLRREHDVMAAVL